MLSAPKPPAFDRVIADSFRPGMTFMNAVVIERFAPDGSSVRLHSLTLAETPTEGEPNSIALADRRELVDAVEGRFGVPGEVTRREVDGVELTAEVYG